MSHSDFHTRSHFMSHLYILQIAVLTGKSQPNTQVAQIGQPSCRAEKDCPELALRAVVPRRGVRCALAFPEKEDGGHWRGFRTNRLIGPLWGKR